MFLLFSALVFFAKLPTLATLLYWDEIGWVKPGGYPKLTSRGRSRACGPPRRFGGIRPRSLRNYLAAIPLAHLIRGVVYFSSRSLWPAPGSEDTELGALMELEVGHGETEVYARVQA